MYSNNKKGFSLLDLLVKIIFFALLIFVLIWLFNKKMPNMKATYSNQFRENVSYMQDAGEAYFTNDKLPQNAGESVRLSLEDMENMNLVLPFVDKDGNACNSKESYVSVTKLEDSDNYELKTYLVCGKEAKTVVKVLGCHNLCGDTCNKEKKCEISKVTEYQFRKLVTGKTTKYSCPSGYTLKGSTCYKSTLKDSISAIVKTTEKKTYVKDATVVKGDAKYTPLAVVVGSKKEEINATSTVTTKTIDATEKVTRKEVNATSTSNKVEVNATGTTTTKTIDATKGSKQVSYTCQKSRVETQCTTVPKQQSYSCNCKTTTIRGVETTTCDTCYKTVQVQTCNDVTVYYNDTCYKTEVTYSCPDSSYTLSGSKCTKKVTTYSCPDSSYTLDGKKCYKYVNSYSCPDSSYTLSGNKCYKNVTTYSCPDSSYTLSGSKCTKKVTTYSCPDSSYTLSGSKCSKNVTTYSCPSGTDFKEGSGSSLKCYKVTEGSVTYVCKDAGYKLNGKTCVKTENVEVVKKECKKTGYKLEGDKCNLYTTTSTKATGKTVDTSYYKYTWSKETELAGYERTGQTREVKGKEICK